MDLTLYRVIGGQKRVALGDLAKDVEFYTAKQDDEGVITLTPVRVIGARGTGDTTDASPSETAGADATATADAPWSP